MVDLSVYEKLKGSTFASLMNEERKRQLENDLLQAQAIRNQQAAATGGGSTPAAIQIVNEMQKAADVGDWDRYDALHQVSKSYAIDRGILPAHPGRGVAPVEPMPLPSQGQDPMQESIDARAVFEQQNPDLVVPERKLSATIPPRVIPGYAEAAGAISATKKGMEEQAQKDVQLRMNPQIEGATKLSSKVGEAQGEAVNALEELKSRMPQLQGLVTRLSDLGKKATYTMVGRGIDAALRQTGIPSLVPESAQARTEYLATVSNQVLPMLRSTFGAQFTEREGQTLRDTLGNDTVSPAEKDAVLRAFIRTQMEKANSKAREVNQREPYSLEEINQFEASIGMPQQKKSNVKFLGFE